MSRCYGHEKTRRILLERRVLQMVGVARIELATPTMSTQGLGRKVAEICRFRPLGDKNSAGTGPLFALDSRKTHARIRRFWKTVLSIFRDPPCPYDSPDCTPRTRCQQCQADWAW